MKTTQEQIKDFETYLDRELTRDELFIFDNVHNFYKQEKNQEENFKKLIILPRKEKEQYCIECTGYFNMHMGLDWSSQTDEVIDYHVSYFNYRRNK